MTEHEKKLLARGAEVVAGDMLLHRKTVGMYRNGQFILTPDGAEELESVVDVEATEAVDKPRRARKQAKPAEEAAPDIAADLAGLDEALGD